MSSKYLEISSYCLKKNFFFFFLTGNQSPADVHVVPESTAGVWSFSGGAQRCVSLETAHHGRYRFGQARRASAVKSGFLIRLPCEILADHPSLTFSTVVTSLKPLSDVSPPTLLWANSLPDQLHSSYLTTSFCCAWVSRASNCRLFTSVHWGRICHFSTYSCSA